VTREEVHARYRLVLLLSRQGRSDQEIAAQVGVTRKRLWSLRVAAQRWAATQAERLHGETPVDALHIREQAIHGLRRRGLLTVGDVARLSDTELLAIRGFGPQAVAELRSDLVARYQDES